MTAISQTQRQTMHKYGSFPTSTVKENRNYAQKNNLSSKLILYIRK